MMAHRFLRCVLFAITALLPAVDGIAVEEHPAQPLLRQGQRALDAGDLATAEGAFAAALEQIDAASTLWQQAAYGLAQAAADSPVVLGTRAASRLDYLERIVAFDPYSAVAERARVSLARERLNGHAMPGPDRWMAQLAVAFSLARQNFATTAQIEEAEALCNAVFDEASGHASLRARARLLAAQMMLFNRREPAKATPLFREAVALATKPSKPWIEATFGLATCRHHTIPITPGGIEEARRLYRELHESVPESPYGRRSLFNLAWIAEIRDYAGDVQDREQAKTLYRQVFKTWPESELAGEAMFRYASTLIQQAHYPLAGDLTWEQRVEKIIAAAETLRAWVEEHPDARIAPGMWEFLGSNYLMLPNEKDYYAKALVAYLHATGDPRIEEPGVEPADFKTNLDRIDGGYLYWMIGCLAQVHGYREAALEYYVRGLTEFETYNRGPSGILQLTENMGFSREEVLDRMRRHYEILGRTPAEVEKLIGEYEFLEPPEGIVIPTPFP